MAKKSAEATTLPENPPETGKVGPGSPPVEHQFQKGETGNRGGRPKGLAKQVREKYGEALVGYAGAALSGYVPYDHPTERDADGRPVRVWEKVSVAERNAIYRDLMDRGYGKAPQFAPIEDDDPLDQGVTGSQLADDLFAELDELAKRRRQRETAAAAGE